MDYVTAMRYPPLYKGLQRGRELSAKSFLIWFAKSIYQGFTIIVMAVLFFDTPMISMVTITFTSLTLILVLNVVTEVTRLNRVVLGSCVGSVLLYFLCVAFLPELLDVSKIDTKFVVFVGITVLVAWMPVYVLNYLSSTYYPTKDQKLMREVASESPNGIKRFCNGVASKLLFWKKEDREELRKGLRELDDL